MAVRAFFESEYMLSAFNHTLITLILKIKNATKFFDFRPINLYNVIYKVIS